MQDYEKKQLSFMNDLVALRPRIVNSAQAKPTDQSIMHTLQAYDEKIGDQEMLQILIVDQKNLIATPLDQRSLPEIPNSSSQISLQRQSWQIPPHG